MAWALQRSVGVGVGIAAIVVPGLANAASAPASAPRSLTFENVFSPAGEPASLHYVAVFKARGGDHRLEVWRDGERRAKRATDAALITYAVHEAGKDNFDLQMLDLHKRISTHLDRTTMYRLGNITDWFDLTHALRHPKGAYQLVRSTLPVAAAGSAAPVAACDWYTLTDRGRATRLCWSRTDRLPLLILDADGTPAWRISAVDHAPLPAGVFTIADQGFVKVDAVRDAERD